MPFELHEGSVVRFVFFSNLAIYRVCRGCVARADFSFYRIFNEMVKFAGEVVDTRDGPLA